MAIKVSVHANDDDALIAWTATAKDWDPKWVGFMIEKRDAQTNEVTTLNNRIPAKAGGGEVAPEGIPSEDSPIRRCIWTDHTIEGGENVAYRVTAVKKSGNGFAKDPKSTSDWTAPETYPEDDADGVSACFNRGTLMSQVVSRMLGVKPSAGALKKFKESLTETGFPPRRYLSGHARHALLTFLADADRRGNEIYAALYECNDEELIEALKAFGARGNILLGNGSSMKKGLQKELAKAGLKVSTRDLSKSGKSSPSVHNKFVVEYDRTKKKALRVLTGSTNWTVSGLCTQLNNVLVVERPKIAQRFFDEWGLLKKAGDELPAALKTANAKWTTDGRTSVCFAATPKESEFAPVLERIQNASDALMFLMFKPGQSPLLNELLKRSEGKKGPYVRGVVSDAAENAKGDIIAHQGRVIRRGGEKVLREGALLPNGIPANNVPSWAREEITRKMFFPAGLLAIVHSKVIVIDPFSGDCMVVTGSHNFSDSASKKNDENLVIVRGNRSLAQAYALHIQGVYDHYSWRAFLNDGGDPNELFDFVKEWGPSGSRAADVKFWMK